MRVLTTEKDLELMESYISYLKARMEDALEKGNMNEHEKLTYLCRYHIIERNEMLDNIVDSRGEV